MYSLQVPPASLITFYIIKWHLPAKMQFRPPTSQASWGGGGGPLFSRSLAGPWVLPYLVRWLVTMSDVMPGRQPRGLCVSGLFSVSDGWARHSLRIGFVKGLLRSILFAVSSAWRLLRRLWTIKKIKLRFPDERLTERGTWVFLSYEVVHANF